MTGETPSRPALSPHTRKSLAFLEGIRADVITRIQGLSEAEALTVPEGSSNCVHWHVGHLLHVQLAHWYTRRGLPPPVELGWKTYFREGRSPRDYDAATPSWTVLLDLYRNYGTDLERRYGDFLEAPLASPFAYLGARFETIDDDLRLLIFHEGEHFVLVKRLLKALGRG